MGVPDSCSLLCKAGLLPPIRTPSKFAKPQCKRQAVLQMGQESLTKHSCNPPQKTPHHTSICRMNCSPACGPKPAMAWINWRPPALLSKVSPATALIVSCRGQLTSSRNVQSMQKKIYCNENLMATKEIHLRTQRLSTCALFWKFWHVFFHFRWNNPRLMRFVAKRYHASSLQRSSKRKKKQSNLDLERDHPRTPKRLGSPPFISHLCRPFGRVPCCPIFRGQQRMHS